MIHTSETHFRQDTKWHDTAHWATRFYHFVLALKLLSGDRSQILRDTNNELLNTYTIFIGSQSNEEHPGSCWKF